MADPNCITCGGEGFTHDQGLRVPCPLCGKFSSVQSKPPPDNRILPIHVHVTAPEINAKSIAEDLSGIIEEKLSTLTKTAALKVLNITVGDVEYLQQLDRQRDRTTRLTTIAEKLTP